MTRLEKYWSIRKIEDETIKKKCSCCGDYKPETYEFFYYKNKSKPEKGFISECKICSDKRSLKTKWDNIEEVRKKQTATYKEKYKNDSEVRRKHAERNKKVRESRYYQEYLKKPEVKARKYGQRHKNHRITDQEWEDCKKYFNYRCAYCGLPIEEHYIPRKGKLVWQDFHKEHVIDKGKNNLKNCVPSCQSCNSKKRIRTLNQWYNPQNSIYTYERYHKIYIWIRYDHKLYIKKNKPKQKYQRKI